MTDSLMQASGCNFISLAEPFKCPGVWPSVQMGFITPRIPPQHPCVQMQGCDETNHIPAQGREEKKLNCKKKRRKKKGPAADKPD